jgi:hypothetical protein
MVYFVLQLIPVLSMLFLLTSAAGSALWAVELEREQHPEPVENSRGERDENDYADPPPPYEDDPI